MYTHAPLRSSNRLDTDMAFGNAGGVTSTLVLTGVSSADDLAQLPPAMAHARPAYVMPSLGTLLSALQTAADGR